MAEEGLPSGGSVGYEVFDRSDSLGSTRTMQNINLLRALEGELERTIRSISQIASARVHLVIPKRELFTRDAPGPDRLGRHRNDRRKSPGQGASPGNSPSRRVRRARPQGRREFRLSITMATCWRGAVTARRRLERCRGGWPGLPSLFRGPYETSHRGASRAVGRHGPRARRGERRNRPRPLDHQRRDLRPGRSGRAVVAGRRGAQRQSRIRRRPAR